MNTQIPKANLPMPVWATLLLGLVFMVMAGPGLVPEDFPSMAAAFPAFATPVAGVLCFVFGAICSTVSIYLLRRSVNVHLVKHGLPAMPSKWREAAVGFAALVFLVLFVAIKKLGD